MNKMTDKELNDLIENVQQQIQELNERKYSAQKELTTRRDNKHMSMWNSLQVDDTHKCIIGVNKTSDHHCALLKGYKIEEVEKNNATCVEFEYREDDYEPSLTFDGQCLYFSELESFFEEFNVFVVDEETYNSVMIELMSLNISYQDYQKFNKILKDCATTVIWYK